MIIVAALAGALTALGIVLLAGELTRRAPAPGRPPRKLPMTGSIGAARKRLTFAVLAGLIMLAVTRWPVAALATAGAVILVPKLTAAKAARERTAKLEGLEQWTRRLSDMLTASRGLEDALAVSAKTAPAAIAGPVTALARRLAARVGTENALRAFADDIDDPAGDRIAAALIIATGRRGGAVHGVLSALAEILARDIAARREIDAEQAQHRTTLRWIAAFVGGFTIFAIMNRTYSAPYGTVVGQVVLALVALLYAAALGWLHRLGMLPGPGRFLQAHRSPAGREPGGRSGASPWAEAAR
ncbi:MAG TPA: type II secretion system F family protein [Streptosporangiaceae bacterium]|nr:type II secretion system F family protein [Streptosporangiaceae bacterium]